MNKQQKEIEESKRYLGPQVDVEALAHDIAMSVGTLIFNDKDWNVSKIEASVRKHLKEGVA